MIVEVLGGLVQIVWVLVCMEKIFQWYSFFTCINMTDTGSTDNNEQIAVYMGMHVVTCNRSAESRLFSHINE